MPSDTTPAAVFHAASSTYDRVGVDFFQVFGRRLVDLAGLAAGEQVLDVGTGRGAVLFPAAHAVGPHGHAVGMDLAPGMVALTAGDITQMGLTQATVRLGDASAPPVDLGTFDAVLSSLVLFFLDDPAAGLRTWASHVTPGGRMGLATFLDDDDDKVLHPLLQEFIPQSDTSPDAPTGKSPFEMVRDPAWLDRAIADAGLAVRTTEVLRHATHFEDVDQWWSWAWSHGMRTAMAAIPSGRHAEFRTAVADRLAHEHGLRLHVTVRFTIADRPAQG